ncbi:MAG: hypothetical protein Q8M24_07950 [Pseudolabrys sp.]|nr:hypothetical protein [Pseudolabrys sp.]MDP2295382.1 hypothetical protein [Pseudolabrys sp.]
MGLLHNLQVRRVTPNGANVESFVMRKRTVETIDATQSAANAEDRSAGRAPPTGEPAKAGRAAQSPWPFNLGDVTPLEWWRTMPADHLGDVQRHHLRATMENICVMKDHQWLSALRGDAAASIAIAIGAMPIDQVTLEVDLAMSALALSALEGSAGAALVLSHILRRTALDHPFGKDLSVSWLALNLCRALTAKSHRRSENANAPKTSPCRRVPA